MIGVSSMLVLAILGLDDGDLCQVYWFKTLQLSKQYWILANLSCCGACALHPAAVAAANVMTFHSLEDCRTQAFLAGVDLQHCTDVCELH